MTKVSGALPKDDGDGLSQYGARFVKYPEQPVVVVAVLTPQSITTKVKTGEREATLGVLHIERVDPEDMDLAATLVRTAYERRAGFGDMEQLPLDLKDKLDDMFDAATRDPRSASEAAQDLARQGVSVIREDGTAATTAEEIEAEAARFVEGSARRGSRAKRGKGSSGGGET